MGSVFWLDEIHFKAVDVLAKYNNEFSVGRVEIPIPVEDILDFMFEVQILLEHLPADLSGTLRIRERIIEVNRSEPEVRRRFTLGHELGHLVLHCKEGRKRMFRDRKGHIREDIQEERLTNKTVPVERGRSKRIESEANVFASEILMPSTLVKNTYKGKTKDIDELASTFKVSRLAMEWKLTNLRLVTGKSFYRVIPFYQKPHQEIT